MGSDEDDLFGSSSDEGGNTDDLIANASAKAKPIATKKRLQKKASPAAAPTVAAPKKRKLPGAYFARLLQDLNCICACALM